MANNNNINKPVFDEYVSELYKINSEDKERAERIARRGLAELGMSVSKEDNSTTDHLGIPKDKALLVGMCILIALCGFLVPNGMAAFFYLFGMIFFLAGLFVGLNVPVFGLIFLCTHGGVGLFLMLNAFFGGFDSGMGLETLFNNPIFSDGGIPNDLKTYCTSLIIIFIITIVYTLLHNLSPKLKEDKKHMLIILFLFFAVILMTGLMPRLFPYVIPSIE